MDNTHIKADIEQIKKTIKKLQKKREHHFSEFKDSQRLLKMKLDFDDSMLFKERAFLKENLDKFLEHIDEINQADDNLKFYRKELEDQEWELERREADNDI